MSRQPLLPLHTNYKLLTGTILDILNAILFISDHGWEKRSCSWL